MVSLKKEYLWVLRSSISGSSSVEKDTYPHSVEEKDKGHKFDKYWQELNKKHNMRNGKKQSAISTLKKMFPFKVQKYLPNKVRNTGKKNRE